MLSYLKNLLLGETSETENEGELISPEKKLQIATCAMFVELANTDDVFSDEEKELIFDLMGKEFSLSNDEINELLDLAEKKVERNVSLYEYTQIINDHFSKKEKYDVLKQLWKIVFIDGKLDAHEEYFVRKVSGNLHMEHQEMIAAKMEVKKELGL